LVFWGVLSRGAGSRFAGVALVVSGALIENLLNLDLRREALFL